jgi:2-polyprenyl-3-methyl-5-hydroxy-6-metoxy-1,4-benzoquinol methylase
MTIYGTTSATTSTQDPGLSGNTVLFHPDANPAYVEKTYGRKPGGWKGAKYALLRALGRDVPVEYMPPEERCAYETECLRLWEERGLPAPRLLEIQSASAARPKLRMEYCAGKTLDELLRESTQSAEDKLDAVTLALRDMRWRHCAALIERERRFIHVDANLRNALVTEDGLVCVDFEMGRNSERFERTCERELKKLCLNTLDLLGRKHLPALAQAVYSEYGVHKVLNQMAKNQAKRWFSSWHLRRDEKRKRGNPERVTKYDLLAAVDEVREASWASRKRVARNAQKLSDAEQTSWDGKFYQSLDDADPRGRDMLHRYEVMRFPEDFTGKSILDIGCNLGRICIDATERGATRSVGIDFREDVMDAMHTHCQERGLNTELRAFDINDGLEALKRVIGDQRFDYLSALSIWSHVDADNLWAIIDYFAADTFILEDNFPSRVQSIPRMQEIIRERLPGATVEFLGFATDRGPRSVFRAKR